MTAIVALLQILAWLQVASAQATYPSEFRLAWCVGTACFDHSISAAHFQLQIGRYYAKAAPPPIQEAFFVATLPAVFLKELLYGCPGLVLLVHLLLAEVRLYTHQLKEAAELVHRCNAMMTMPEIAGPHLDGVRGAWPLAQAFNRYAEVLQVRASLWKPLSVDIVLPHCREDLSWLSDQSLLEVLPPQTRIFIYDKCGNLSNGVPDVAVLRGTGVTLQVTKLVDARDPETNRTVRRDECTAYLSHLVRHYGSDMADVLLFLHGTPADHTPMGLLKLVLRGIALGSFVNIDFLHLGTPRMVATANPCQAELFELALGRKMQQPLSTYCCAQFAVSHRQIMARPRTDYLRMLRLVDGSVADACERIGPSYELYPGQRLSHCYFFEFMWHVVFGEDEELPLRAEDVRLPAVFRLQDYEQGLPSIWKSYLAAFVGGHASFEQQGHTTWLRQFQLASDVGVRRQVNFGDTVE